ncbi:hypothetical protein B484DRAFT_440228, partial [Ochromonadaceae sp. CCMP2298]
MALALLLLVAAALLGKSFANVFPYTTGTLTNTNNALQNTAPVSQDACLGDVLQFSTCSQYTGNTYIRLYLNGANVISNNNSGTNSGSLACSTITYTYSAAACGTLVLQLGCYGATSCSMTATVVAAATFPYTTGTLTNTNDALQNTVPVSQDACPGDVLQFSTCSQYTGNTYIRLYLNGINVISKLGSCSRISYTYSAAACGTLVLQLGCYRDTSSSMTATVAVKHPTTPQPTYQPSAP